MSRTPVRRLAAIVLELLLVLLVVVGGGGECRVVDGESGGAHAAHAAHGAHATAHPGDDAGGHEHGHHSSANRSPAGGDAPVAPDCVMSAACAPVLAAADVPLLALPAAPHGDPADPRPHTAPLSAVRQVEPPPPRA